MPGVIALAALSGPLPKLGVIVAAGAVIVALLHPAPGGRAAAMAAGLVLAPVLLLAEIWHSPQLGVIHRHPLVAAGIGLAGLVLIVAVAAVILRRPFWLAPLVILALPFRVPIEAGGTTSNLLVPLYLVVGAGALAFIWRVLRPATQPQPGEFRADPLPAGWLERLLALYVGLYAIQATYSSDFEKALQQMVFFYLPFGFMFCQLRQLRFSARVLHTCLLVAVGLALVLAAVGFAEYATKTLFLNPKLIAANDVHAYFTVNSVFFDPDIFGRFLALVMILVAATLLYGRQLRQQLAALAVLAVLWGGLVLTLSRSSLGALLLGLSILGAMRWRAKPILLAGVVVVAAGAAAIAISPKTFGLNQGLNGATSGRTGLVSGGWQLFTHRPVWGYGSGSFEVRYRALNPRSTSTLSASHTIAVTIAAEQGLIGELPYLALVVVAAVMLVQGARGDPYRAAIAAAFLALVFHTQLYADFLEDPVSWTLLGAGVALAYAARARSSDPALAAAPQPAAVA
jgi:putative inorganic carbon (HCO3(-)) transporter